MNMVTLKIDNQTVTVPEGTLVVNAAKMVDIDIPVFCYHPKMEPVGMCRMCLVDIGRPMIDRATNQPVLDADGSPKIQFAPKLETACTVPVSEGMVVVTRSEKVATAREDMLEFLLTSHPLDCPVCDKGGECPLQNLTMGFGPGESRFKFDEKMHLAKHKPLGELIFLDRERCIQCARCVRFQKDIADDPVLGFTQRGRSLEIFTDSTPGFDSIFSGNTTDICPVGALTTADFRFGARPWELKQAASICNQCPVGCNTTLNLRREAKAGGRPVIKRVMPRQNEEVNEIWICDKGRFGYHFTESPERLQQPLVRKNGELVPVSWDEALQTAADGLQAAGTRLVGLASGRLSNEDLFNLRELVQTRGGRLVQYGALGGGEWVSKVGVGVGTNLGALGKGSAVLVVACDLHEEAPVWWLRVKQAAQRGAAVIVVNPRETRLDKFATHRVRYTYGEEVETLAGFMPGAEASDSIRAAAEAFAGAENGIIIYGGEGLGLTGSNALAQTAARLLTATQHTGKAHNGLLAAWSHGNTQGAWELGFTPQVELPGVLAGASAVLVAGADPAGDAPALADALDRAGFVVVQELFMTETAKRADVVLPVQAFTEREGTYTSGERRVQRFYPAVVGPMVTQRADFVITAQIAQKMGLDVEGRAAALVLTRLAAQVPAFAGLSFQALAEVKAQWPAVGRSDLYYGGTGYDNRQGLGKQLSSAVERGDPASTRPAEPVKLPFGGLVIVPVARLLDQGALISRTDLLGQRLTKAVLTVNPRTAAELQAGAGERIRLMLNGVENLVTVALDDRISDGVGLLPRSVGFPIDGPVVAQTSR